MLGVLRRQSYQWHTRCDDDASHCIIMFLLANPVEATRCGAAVLFIKNIAEN